MFFHVYGSLLMYNVLRVFIVILLQYFVVYVQKKKENGNMMGYSIYLDWISNIKPRNNLYKGMDTIPIRRHCECVHSYHARHEALRIAG